MFSTGQLVFALLFLITFIVVMIFAYRKDKTIHQKHYKGTAKVFVAFMVFILLLFFIKVVMKR